jgi:SRSO17 transposase
VSWKPEEVSSGLAERLQSLSAADLTSLLETFPSGEFRERGLSWPKTSEIAAAARLEQFFSGIGVHLKDRRKRESFAMYATGILGDGERKSAEPIAARACPDPMQTNNMHSKLCYFLARSEWDDRAVRLEAARYAIAAVQKREPITTWIVDDTGFLKQGKHSVGVQRQYTGSAGKIANCQIGVSLAVATRSEQFPIDFELYLPRI